MELERVFSLNKQAECNIKCIRVSIITTNLPIAAKDESKPEVQIRQYVCCSLVFFAFAFYHG